MKFRRLPITSALDTTQNFEQLQAALKAEVGAQVARAVNTEFEPSRTKDVLVVLQLNSKAAEVSTTCSLKVSGVQVGTVSFPKLAEEAAQTVSLLVPHGERWEVKVTAGALSALNSSYAVLRVG